MNFKKTGVITPEELKSLGLMPGEEILEKKPLAIIECPEEIPCNICVSACPFRAIVKEKLYSKPRLIVDKCIGCGVCVAKCPGQAIFVIGIKKDHSLITLPYEFLPAPSKGDRVILLDREGREIGLGEIVKVWNYDSTWVVTVKAPRDQWANVRGIRVVKEHARP
ncbi:4Fe-4S binding protein [Thermogladius sp. 4427co]|uniref:4Fe-4S binding protein n=1 Tax=Thermogladius sp. 4427co TaxID=3450718 RepID=UPI003F799B71